MYPVENGYNEIEVKELQKTILIIEDDIEINDMLCILLQQNGYQTVSAFSGTEGLLVPRKDISLILLDLMLPGKNGEKIIGELKAKHHVPVIVMSAIFFRLVPMTM